MARTMAGDEHAYRVIVKMTYIGPDVYSKYNPGMVTKAHGWTDETICGPYSKHSTAKGIRSSMVRPFQRENDYKMSQGLPPEWDIDARIQKAKIVWEDVND